MKFIMSLAILSTLSLPIFAATTDGIIYKKNTKSKFPQDVQDVANLFYGKKSPSTRCNQNAKYRVVLEIVSEIDGVQVYGADMWVFDEQDQTNMSGTDPVSGKKYRIHNFMITAEKGQKPDMSQYSCETLE